MGSIRGISGVVAVLACLGVGVSVAGGAERVERKVSCSLDGTTLTVTSNGPDTVIARRGDEIVVSDYQAERVCEGGAPNVHNVDTVLVGRTDRATFDLRRGILAPGATPEGDGSSEIEIELMFGSLNSVDVSFGRGQQKVRLGELPGGGGGVNLNAQDDRATADADLMTLPGRGFDSEIALEVLGGGGDDLLTTRGGRGFEGPWPQGSVAFLGGEGDDRLVGPHSHFNLLAGGPGDDRIRAGRDLDLVVGGRGRDHISAGRGPDVVIADDRQRDRVDCGRGRDSFAADRRDATRRCEEDLGRGDRRRPVRALRRVSGRG